MTVATAPGKLVLFGDYAVLRGAPAAATAVGVRARATVDVIDAPESTFLDLAGGTAYRFAIESGAALRWLDESPAQRGTIIEAVLGTCHGLAHLNGPLPSLRISLNTNAFFKGVGGSAVKLGLGSSAALVVALAGALLDALEIDVGNDSMLNICSAAHRGFQGEQGSGVDVATSLLGGTVGVHRMADDPTPVAEPLPWPDGLLMRAAWSGTSASTPELLSRFNRYAETSPEEFASHLRFLTRFAQQADGAWRRGHVGELLSALAGYDNALRTLDYDADIGVNTDAHEQLRGLTERHGAVYKTSGAGGGDFGIVFSDSAEVMTKVADEVAAAGYMLLDRELNVEGLTIDA